MSERRVKPIHIVVFVILAALALRVWYALDNPLSGDEVGVGMLQAAGQATTYEQHLPAGVAPVEHIQRFVGWSPNHPIGDVLDSLRNTGSHPPLYYLLLHAFMRFGGNGAFTLRILSAVMSLASILVMYLIGREVWSETAGLLAALFLALSSYGVMYGVMVRPYPLAMLLSLLSTYQMLEMSREGTVDLRSVKSYLYILTISMGMYTIYHFVFILVCHLVYLAIRTWRERYFIFRICALGVLAALAYAPWITSWLDQMGIVKSKQFYFHGESSAWSFASRFTGVIILGENSIARNTFVGVIIAVVVYGIILLGCIYSIRNKKARAFLAAAITYISVWLIADRIMGTSTLAIDKLLFFLVPASLLFLAAGVSRLPGRSVAKTTASFVICCMLLLGLTGTLRDTKGFDGPPDVHSFRSEIIESIGRDRESLLLIRVTQRRFLFPLVHGIKKPLDVMIVWERGFGRDPKEMSQSGDYDIVLVANFERGKKSIQSFSRNELIRIKELLQKQGFRQEKVSNFAFSSRKRNALLYVFERR